jgi:hypothetical protein
MLPTFKNRRIYVASSWRNDLYAQVVAALRGAGHECYDWRNPGFRWGHIDPNFRNWSIADCVTNLFESPAAARQYQADRAALDQCDTCILLLPCGKSAHMEAGYICGQIACGQKKQVIVFLDKGPDPELMHLLARERGGFVDSIESLLLALTFAPDGDVSVIDGVLPCATP